MFSAALLPLYSVRAVTHPKAGFVRLFHADCHDRFASILVSSRRLRRVLRLIWAICVVAGPLTVSSLQAVQILVATTRVRRTIFIIFATVLVLAVPLAILLRAAFTVLQFSAIRRGVSRVRA